MEVLYVLGLVTILSVGLNIMLAWALRDIGERDRERIRQIYSQIKKEMKNE